MLSGEFNVAAADGGNNTQYFVPIDQLQFDEIIEVLSTRNIEVAVKMYDLHARSSFVTPIKPRTLAITKKVPYNYERLEILCSFEVKNDRYFFKTRGSSEDNVFVLNYPDEICKLQRRNDFRVTVPHTVSQKVEIEGKRDLKIEVRDLSLGGCQIAIRLPKALEIPPDKFMRLSLQVLDFEEPKLDCEIRFSKYIEETKTALVGLKFIDLPSDQTTSLQNTLIQIDRILRGKNQD